MPESDSVRANISAPMIASPIETSYDTICALERKAPSKAYFEFDDQPARIKASTPTLVDRLFREREAAQNAPAAPLLKASGGD